MATWNRLVLLEQELAELYRKAQRAQPAPGQTYCKNVVWKEDVQKRLCQLVGWNRWRHGVLGTSEALKVASDKLYNALPECQRGCGCPAQHKQEQLF